MKCRTKPPCEEQARKKIGTGRRTDVVELDTDDKAMMRDDILKTSRIFDGSGRRH
jgi:hypothetical protein